MDVIMFARRVLEEARERKDQRILMLALDWSKAFDSFFPERLVLSLRRFGIPAAFVE